MVHLEEIWVKFVYEGHHVKVKVTGVKNSCNVKISAAITPIL